MKQTQMRKNFSAASITGIEKQLTVPSRRFPTRVDLWFSMTRSTAGQLWDAEFDAIRRECEARTTALGSIEIFPFTPERGWIVVREVNVAAISLAEVEAQLVSAVQRANSKVDDLFKREEPMIVVPEWRRKLSRVVQELSSRTAAPAR